MWTLQADGEVGMRREEEPLAKVKGMSGDGEVKWLKGWKVIGL